MRKMEFKEKKISEKRTVTKTTKVSTRTIFDSRTVRTFNGRQDKKFHGNQYRITGSYTIQIDAKPTRRTRDWASIFGKGGSGPRNYGLWIASNGTPLAQTYGPAGSNAHGSKAVPLNKWSTFTMVYKKHQYIALYMNGKRISKTTSRSGHPRTDNQPLTIVKASFHTGFIGQLKNAKIWKSALNDGQVKKSYRKPKKGGKAASWSGVQSRRQCINKVQKGGDRRDNPIFGGGGFIGSLTLNDCKKQCTKRKDR